MEPLPDGQGSVREIEKLTSNLASTWCPPLLVTADKSRIAQALLYWYAGPIENVSAANV
jgi:hypothetical protein